VQHGQGVEHERATQHRRGTGEAHKQGVVITGPPGSQGEPTEGPRAGRGEPLHLVRCPRQGAASAAAIPAARPVAQAQRKL
jgi:hypothetical protein